MFHITDGKGFHVTFDNGWVVSVQWGSGNYGPNYNERTNDYDALRALNQKLGAEGAPVAEVASWNSKVKHGHKDGFDVVEYPMTPDQLVKYMAKVAKRA